MGWDGRGVSRRCSGWYAPVGSRHVVLRKVVCVPEDSPRLDLDKDAVRGDLAANVETVRVHL